MSLFVSFQGEDSSNEPQIFKSCGCFSEKFLASCSHLFEDSLCCTLGSGTWGGRQPFYLICMLRAGFTLTFKYVLCSLVLDIPLNGVWVELVHLLCWKVPRAFPQRTFPPLISPSFFLSVSQRRGFAEQKSHRAAGGEFTLAGMFFTIFISNTADCESKIHGRDRSAWRMGLERRDHCWFGVFSINFAMALLSLQSLVVDCDANPLATDFHGKKRAVAMKPTKPVAPCHILNPENSSNRFGKKSKKPRLPWYRCQRFVLGRNLVVL